jgi:acyl dehydratase
MERIPETRAQWPDGMAREIPPYRFATLERWIGRELEASDWVLIDQSRINAFAHCTGDLQWMHVDEDRCRRESPYGEPIAHGFLSLSLMAKLLTDLGGVPPDASGAINVAINNVRFHGPVRVGTRVRVRASIADVVPAGRAQRLVTAAAELEAEGGDSALVTAEIVVLMFCC